MRSDRAATRTRARARTRRRHAEPRAQPRRGLATPVARWAPGARGGMIAIGGPPLGGKSVLAALLAERLPNALRIEAIDDLSRAAPYWIDAGDRASPASVTTSAILGRARQIWRGRRDQAPTLLVVTRFASSTERRRAKVHAQLAGMRFLFVEVRSREDRALRRIPVGLLSRKESEVRMRRYDAAVRSYAPVSRVEGIALPALRLLEVLSHLQDAVGEVMAAWETR